MNQHIFFDNLTATIGALATGKKKFFSQSITSHSFLELIEKTKINFPEKIQEGTYELEAETAVGNLDPAFIWTVRLKMAPFISVLGRDKFIDGKGEMQMTLNGLINLGKETGEKMDEGTLQRYLGETVWFPSGMASPHISWEELDAHSARATMNFNGTIGSGTFYFNNEGFFEKFIAMRFYGNTPDAKRYEWIITAQEHAEFNGIKIPSKMEATWMLESGSWTWLKLKIIDIRYNTGSL